MLHINQALSQSNLSLFKFWLGGMFLANDRLFSQVEAASNAMSRLHSKVHRLNRAEYGLCQGNDGTGTGIFTGMKLQFSLRTLVLILTATAIISALVFRIAPSQFALDQQGIPGDRLLTNRELAERLVVVTALIAPVTVVGSNCNSAISSQNQNASSRRRLPPSDHPLPTGKLDYLPTSIIG
jgi:hypothetical protein